MSNLLDYLRLGKVEELSRIEQSSMLIAGALDKVSIIPPTHLKKIDLSSTQLSPNHLKVLILASPLLEELSLKEGGLYYYYDTKVALLDLPEGTITQIKKLNFSEKGGVSISLNFLKALPLIEELDLGSNVGLVDFHKLSPHYYKHLKKLAFQNSSLDNVNAFAKTAPNLEELELPRCRLFGKFEPPVNLFPNLKVFKLGLEIYNETAGLTSINIADALPKLEVCEIETRRLEEIKLPPTVKHLTLKYHDKATAKCLTDLLTMIPNLETLDLSGTGTIEGILTLAPGSLSHLKSLTIRGSKINAENLAVLLQAAPNLERLELGQCEEITDLHIAPSSLMKLKDIDLSQLKLTSSSLQRLFKATPNVEKLSLSDIQCSVFKPVSLKYLKTLRQSYGVESFSLSDVLDSAPNLEHLENISVSDKVQLKIKPGSLSNLKKVDFWYVNPSNLITFLKATPNLTALNMGSSFDNTWTRPMNFSSDLLFPNITSIKIGEYISKENWEKLLKMFPNLKSKYPPKKFAEYDKKPEQYRTSGPATGGPPPMHGQEGNLDSKGQGSNAPGGIADHTQPMRASKDYLDTSPIPKKLRYKKYFPDLDPSRYRTHLWRYDLNSLNMIPIVPTFRYGLRASVEKHAGDYLENCDYHKGRITVSSRSNQKVTLPSIDPNENVFDIQLIDENGKVVKTYKKEEVGYCQETGFTQIEVPKGNYTVHFLVEIPDKKNELTKELKNVLTDYNNYGDQELPKNPDGSPKEYKTWAEFAKDIDLYKTGACRHRAVAAYAKLLPRYGNNVRARSNDVHATIEVRIGNEWHELDLGGWEANLEAVPMPVSEIRDTLKKDLPQREPQPPGLTQPTAATKTPQANIAEAKEKSPELTQPTAATKTPQANIAEAKEKSPELTQPEQKPALTNLSQVSLEELIKEKRPALVQVTSDADVRDFLLKLKETTKSDEIFMARRPTDLVISESEMTTDGVMVEKQNRFQRWLKEHPTGQLCIDMRRFTASEKAQLNDILDRILEENRLPEGISIKLIDNPNVRYGPDFRRRVPVKASAAGASSLLLRSPPTDIKSGEAKDTVEIDLFNSFYWRRTVTGTWKLKPHSSGEGMAFYWEQGDVLKLLLSDHCPKNIIFKNAPVHDPDFNLFMAELQSLQRVEWANQTTYLKNPVNFFARSGYDWQKLCTNASVAQLDEKDRPLVLTESSILSFIQDPRFQFSKITNKLELTDSYFKQYAGIQKMDVMCGYGLTEGTLALFVDAAKQYGIQIRFVCPSLDTIPPVLKNVSRIEESKKAPVSINKNMTWQVHEDVEFATRRLLFDNPTATYMDMSALTPAELGRYPELKDQDAVKKGKLILEAKLSPLIQKLKQEGQHIILSGKIPPALYGELAALSLGHFDGEPLKGKLTIIAPPEDMKVIEAITGKLPITQKASIQQKSDLLKDYYKLKDTTPLKGEIDFASIERTHLKKKLQQEYKPLVPDDKANDEKKADLFDQERLGRVQAALKINPWVMIPGATGIGKSHFLEQILPADKEHCQCETSFKKWLEAKAQNKDVILILDEASFKSELKGQGKNFLERLKGLRNNPPTVYWNGEEYKLTPNHKVVLAFNPASYGAGRSTEGFLDEQALNVSFQALPAFYIRARLINPLLKDILKNKEINLDLIANPLLEVYRHIVLHSPVDDILITPRQIKMMVNLIAAEINEKNITDPRIISRLAGEMAYIIGQQTLLDTDQLGFFQERFAKYFSPKESGQAILSRKRPRVPGFSYPAYQLEAYSLIQNVMQARSTLTTERTDPGLGGILLEGASGIGKTFFLDQIIQEHKKTTGKETIRIKAGSSDKVKREKLKEAFEKGTLVVIEEMNTDIWPNEVLNNYMMGKDEFGNLAKTPGFMLLATQNPVSFAGRHEIDPAIRQRVVKLKLDWPVYQPDVPKIGYEPEAPQAEARATPANLGEIKNSGGIAAALAKAASKSVFVKPRDTATITETKAVEETFATVFEKASVSSKQKLVADFLAKISGGEAKETKLTGNHLSLNIEEVVTLVRKPGSPSVEAESYTKLKNILKELGAESTLVKGTAKFKKDQGYFSTLNIPSINLNLPHFAKILESYVKDNKELQTLISKFQSDETTKVSEQTILPKTKESPTFGKEKGDIRAAKAEVLIIVQSTQSYTTKIVDTSDIDKQLSDYIKGFIDAIEALEKKFDGGYSRLDQGEIDKLKFNPIERIKGVPLIALEEFQGRIKAALADVDRSIKNSFEKQVDQSIVTSATRRWSGGG